MSKKGLTCPDCKTENEYPDMSKPLFCKKCHGFIAAPMRFFM